MKPAVAKSPDNKGIEDVGRATLKIVHDLKNRLNGIKLYATFLRKRLEREENFHEERETVAKLIAGIDRAANDMTALIRYARPLELRRRTGVDLRRMVEQTIEEIQTRLNDKLNVEIESGVFCGELDATALGEAFRALSQEALRRTQTREANVLSLRLCRDDASHPPSALIEWKSASIETGRLSLDENRSVQAALAVRIIEAHEGSVEFQRDTIRAKLPLSE